MLELEQQAKKVKKIKFSIFRIKQMCELFCFRFSNAVRHLSPASAILMLSMLPAASVLIPYLRNGHPNTLK